MPAADSSSRKHTRIVRTMVGVATIATVIAVLLFITDPSRKLVIENALFSVANDERFVSGVVRNHTDTPFSNVTVHVDLQNGAGKVVGTASVTAEQVPAGGTWRFSAKAEAPQATRFTARVFSPDNMRPIWLGGCFTTTAC